MLLQSGWKRDWACMYSMTILDCNRGCDLQSVIYTIHYTLSTTHYTRYTKDLMYKSGITHCCTPFFPQIVIAIEPSTWVIRQVKQDKAVLRFKQCSDSSQVAQIQICQITGSPQYLWPARATLKGFSASWKLLLSCSFVMTRCSILILWRCPILMAHVHLLRYSQRGAWVIADP